MSMALNNNQYGLGQLFFQKSAGAFAARLLSLTGFFLAFFGCHDRLSESTFITNSEPKIPSGPTTFNTSGHPYLPPSR
jgi:hypothetical protein